MKNTDLRIEFTTETKTRFNVEWIAYNDYAEWLEQKLLKLLTMPYVSNNEVAVGCHTCKHNPHSPFVPEICDECNSETLSKWQATDC